MRKYTPESHEDWLEYRRQRLTSTELAGLHLHKQAGHWQQLRAEKESGRTQFGENEYTKWGTAREPYIAKALDPTLPRGDRDYPLLAFDSRLRYNAEPQTIIISENDPRLCCTPDLFSEDGEVIGEIKTSGHPFAGGRYHAWAPDQYYLQCQLNMHYCGAEACVLMVEYRGVNPEGGFVTTGHDERILDYDKHTISELMATADEWWRWIKSDERPGWMGEVAGLDQADELAEAVEKFHEAKIEADSWTAKADAYKAQIVQLVGGSYTGEIAGHVLSVSVLGPSKTFDSKAFKKAHADLYEEYRTKERAGYTRISLKEVS